MIKQCLSILVLINLWSVAPPVMAQKIIPMAAPDDPDMANQPVFVIKPPAAPSPLPGSVQAPSPITASPAATATGANSAKDTPTVDTVIGQPIRVQAIDLPAATAPIPHNTNPPPRALRPPRGGLTLPEGFTATLWAQGLNGPRNMVVLPNGDVVVSEQIAGRITIIRDANNDGVADRIARMNNQFRQPAGLALGKDGLYVVDRERIWRLPLSDGLPRIGLPPEPITNSGALGNGTQPRSLILAPDGKHFYVGIASHDNLAEEAIPAASIQEFTADGKLRRTYAYGLRDPVGLGFVPGTDTLCAAVDERDGMGPSLVPDFLTCLNDGGFYGWPYSFIGPNAQPGMDGKRPDLIGKTLVPDLLFLAHSSPTDLLFYAGTMFPEKYRNGAFVTMGGSDDHQHPVGYSVAFIPFDKDKPAPAYEAFASGFLTPDGNVWGKPAGLAQLPDGSLLVSDMLGGTIWRIVYP